MSVFQAVPALIGAYDPEFRERMPVSPEETCDESSARARARALPSEVRDLLDTLLLACGAGEPVDPRFRDPIDAVGEALWFHGFLLPQVRPRRGSTVDPRYYAASCRLTPALRRRRPLGEILLSPDQELNPGFPPSDARWDALVVAARLELDPPVLTKEGRMRKDTRERILKSLGDEWIRWDLAVRYAQATGLARKAGGRLLGFPEATPRALADPVAVLDDQDMPAGRVLLRLVHDNWLHMTEVLQVLRDHCRWVLHSPEGEAYAESPGQAYDGAGWDRVEAAAFKRVSEIMVRTRVWDAQLDTDGPTAVRKALPEQRRSTGFMLTPDLDILVTPGELGLRDYGRLCRLAPYQEGDRVHRHKLSREGIGADLAAGHNDALVFLEGLSRTGMPSTVTQTLNGWMRTVARVTLFTGVNVVEQDGELVRAAAVPDDARVIEYGRANPPPASFLMVDGEVRVPRGQDALTVRAVLRQVAEPQASTASHHVYRLAPEPLDNPEHTLESLRQLHVEGDLPGELEVAVLAAQGMEACTVEPALVIHVPERAAEPVRRDRIAGPLLNRQVAPTQFLVALADLETLRARLQELGVILDLSGYQPA